MKRKLNVQIPEPSAFWGSLKETNFLIGPIEDSTQQDVIREKVNKDEALPQPQSK